jgi:tRNA dimethylallyltransferase
MQDAIHIAGPTASGKSAVALALAERIGGEIISVDSMQVYRGLDIGTAKPTAGERARVRHHLIDVAGMDQPFDAAQFVALARAAEREIRDRGRRPIFCGGTGLYFNALIGGLAEVPPADPALRVALENTPMEQLLEELRAGNHETFARIDRQNPRRVVRAVEILRATGRPPPRTWSKGARTGYWFGLDLPRPVLNQRIEARVDRIFQAGWVEETRRLLANGLEQNRAAMQAIGYRQVVEHLRGDRDLPSTIALIKQKTRQYAKRQATWFRRQLELDWLAVGEAPESAAILVQILAKIA